MFRFQPEEDGTLTPSAAVHQAIGAASMCWSKVPDGVFDTEQAGEIAEALLEQLGFGDGDDLTYEVEIYLDAGREWRWRLVAENGRIVGTSAEGYVRESHAARMAHQLYGGQARFVIAQEPPF